MKPETRLAQMKKYLADAMLDPVANKLYIEDLNLSIEFFDKYVSEAPPALQVMSGFVIDS